MKNAFSINIIFVLLTVLGFSIIPSLSVRFAPSKKTQYLTITYSWEGVQPEVIEKEVTSKLEGLASTLKSIKEISSTSAKGQGSILVELDKDANIKASKFELNSLIRSAFKKLPKNVTIPLVTEGKSKSRSQEVTPILYYSITGNHSLEELQKNTEHLFNSPLSSVEGVEELRFYGATPYQWELVYDEKKLDSYQVSIEDIEELIKSYLKNRELGIGLTYGNKGQVRQQFIQYKGHKEDSILWDHIPLKKIGAKIIYLGNVLDSVSYKPQKKRGFPG